MRSPLSAFVLAVLSVASWGAPCHGQDLPCEAKVGIWKLVNPKASSGIDAWRLVPGKFDVDFNGDGRPYRVVFYTVPNAIGNCSSCRASLFDLMDTGGVIERRFVVTWPGNPGMMATAEWQDPTGPQQLLPGEPPLIVAFAQVGASAGGILHVFRWNRQQGALQDVSGPWNETDQVEDVRFLDVNNDGDKEILFLHHRASVTSRYGPESVYRWNGKRFERWPNPPRRRAPAGGAAPH